MSNYIGPKGLKARAGNKAALEKLNKKPGLSTLKKKLQDKFNLFIRLRDTKYDNGQAYFICISCGERFTLDQMNAGHYFPVGNNEAVRYDEDNTHGQCVECNCYNHGNLMEYKPRIIAKIGKERFERLEIKRHNLSKMTAFEVEWMIDEYDKKIQTLLKR